MPTTDHATDSTPIRRPVAQLLITVAALASCLALGACGGAPSFLSATNQSDKPAESDVATGSLPKTDLQKATEYWGKQYQATPTDAKAAVNYVRNLKALGAKQQALQVIQQAYAANPGNKTIASEYGRLALEQDQLSLAERLLDEADDPVAPDWKTISARGTVLAKQNRYREAISQFERARTIAPDQPTVLNNLALAYAMDGHAEKAEPLLRQAALAKDADPKVGQNLSLVLGLEGRSDEAKAVMVRSVPGDDGRDDVAYVQHMVGASQPEPFATNVKTATATSTKPAAGSTAQRSPKRPSDAIQPAQVDPSVLVKQLADGYTATPGDGPVQLTPSKQ